MISIEKQYLNLLKIVLEEGTLEPNRTGVSAYTYSHAMLKHDMSDGFPLLTTKKMAWKSLKVELEFFIKGLTDKKWLQDRGCNIWNEWCSQSLIPPELSESERKEFQLKEMDLGPIYGAVWSNHNGFNQFKRVVDELKTNPNNRQLVCSAWNPNVLDQQALPPCHVLWHVFKSGGKLHLCFIMRSVDCGAGLPFNIASYALLLHLLSLESNISPGYMSAFLSNVHVYENHVDAVKEQLKREPYDLPTVKTDDFKSIFDWEYKDTELVDYKHHPAIKLEIAV